VLSSELSNAANLQNYYGYGMDVAVWSKRRFTFQDKIVFSFYNVLLQPDEKTAAQPVMIRIYEHHDRYSLLQTNFLQSVKGADGTLGMHTMLDVITSLHDKGLGLSAPNQPLSPSATVYCFALAWRDEASAKTGFVHLTVDESGVILQGNNKKFDLRLRDTQLFSTIRETIKTGISGRKAESTDNSTGPKAAH